MSLHAALAAAAVQPPPDETADETSDETAPPPPRLVDDEQFVKEFEQAARETEASVEAQLSLPSVANLPPLTQLWADKKAESESKRAAGKPVKMTELLHAVVGRLHAMGDGHKATTVLATAAKYRAGEATYQQAMSTMAEVVGLELLVQEARQVQTAAAKAEREAWKVRQAQTASAGASAEPPAEETPSAEAGEGARDWRKKPRGRPPKGKAWDPYLGWIDDAQVVTAAPRSDASLAAAFVAPLAASSSAPPPQAATGSASAEPPPTSAAGALSGTSSGPAGSVAAGSAAALARGSIIAVRGIQSRPELNGKEGIVLSFNAASQRYNVLLHNWPKVLALQAANLLLATLEASSPPEPAGTPPSAAPSAGAGAVPSVGDLIDRGAVGCGGRLGGVVPRPRDCRARPQRPPHRGLRGRGLRGARRR